MSLLLNAVFHHSLMLIPQQEIPGVVPAAYVMRHPQTGNVEVSFLLYIGRLYIFICQILKYSHIARQRQELNNLLLHKFVCSSDDDDENFAAQI